MVGNYPTCPWQLDDLGLRRLEDVPEVPAGLTTIPALIETLTGDEAFLIDRQGTLSGVQLKCAVESGAAALAAAGVRKGDRVAASSVNCNALITAFLAVQRIGAIWVGVGTALAGPEASEIMRDCDAAYLLASDKVADAWSNLNVPSLRTVWRLESDWARMLEDHDGEVPPSYRPDPHAPAAIAYTSGTTGTPKGAVHTNHSIMTFVQGGLASGRGGHWTPGLRRSVTIPLTILNGMCFGPLTAIAGGDSYVSLDRIDAEGVAQWIANASIEMLGSTPTTILDIFTRPDLAGIDLSSLRYAFTGGAAGSPNLRDMFRKRTGSELCEEYGMTESPAGVTGSTASEPPEPGGVGRAYPHIEIAALSEEGDILPPGAEGELCLRASQTGPWAGVYTGMKGYWGKPELTHEAFRFGWMHTGDMGKVDASGNVAIVGRKKDLIIRGGANIYPAEIERVVVGDPDVVEAVAAPIPDDRLGEIVGMYLRLRPEVEPSEALVGRICAHTQQNLAKYKVPARWFVVEDFPRNAMNKVMKRDLAEYPSREFTPR